MLDRLPNLGNPQLNWKQKFWRTSFREEIKRGLPIRDASSNNTTGIFLNAERNLHQAVAGSLTKIRMFGIHPSNDMAQDDRIIGRSSLHFSHEVKKCFLFLEDLDFCCVRSEDTFVRYESPMMGINIYHGRQSYEISLEIQSVQAPIEMYSISEILSLVDPQNANIWMHRCDWKTDALAWKKRPRLPSCPLPGLVTN